MFTRKVALISASSLYSKCGSRRVLDVKNLEAAREILDILNPWASRRVLDFKNLEADPNGVGLTHPLDGRRVLDFKNLEAALRICRTFTIYAVAEFWISKTLRRTISDDTDIDYVRRRVLDFKNLEAALELITLCRA